MTSSAADRGVAPKETNDEQSGNHGVQRRGFDCPGAGHRRGLRGLSQPPGNRPLRPRPRTERAFAAASRRRRASVCRRSRSTAGHSSPVSVSRNASSNSFCLALSLVGVSTSTRTTRSPRPRPCSTGMPAPRWRNSRPDWMPAGIWIVFTAPSGPGNVDLAAQRRGREADRRARVKRRALALEQRVALHVQEDVEVARRCAACARLALARQADARAFVDAGRDVDVERAGLLDPARAAALRARIDDLLARALAGRTGPLDHEEALLRADLADAAAGRAGLHAGAGLRALAVAGLAGDASRRSSRPR